MTGRITFALAGVAMALACAPGRAAEPPAATVNARGHAEAPARLDAATLSLGVMHRAATATAAAEASDAAGRAVLDALAAAGVPRQAPRTVLYEVAPTQPGGDDRKLAPGDAYTARIGYEVPLQDPSRAAPALSAAVAAGANDVGGVSWESRPDPSRDADLLVAAVADARRMAGAMAAAAGMRLGTPVSINPDRAPRTFRRNFASMASDATREAPVQSGQGTASVDVDTTWTLLPP